MHVAIMISARDLIIEKAYDRSNLIRHAFLGLVLQELIGLCRNKNYIKFYPLTGARQG